MCRVVRGNMFICVPIDHVTKVWPYIADTVSRALPPSTYASPYKVNNIVAALMRGDMQCWLYSHDGKEIGAVALTTVTEDECTGIRNLLIYCMAGYDKIERHAWLEGINRLREFAKSQGCYQITGYTKSARVKRVVDMVGGNTDYRFISIGLEA